MNGLLSFFLAGAALAGAVEDQAPKPKIDVSAQIYMPDGKASGASRRVEIGTDPVVLYVYTGKTLCEARTVSAERPVVAGNGWRVDLTPASPTAAKGVVQVKATWQKLWEGGQALANSAASSRVVTLSPDSPLPLDTIDGAARRMARDAAAKLKQWKIGDPIPAGPASDPVVVEIRDDLEVSEHERGELKRGSGYADGHPRIVLLTKQIDELKRQLNEKVKAWIDSHPEVMIATPPSADGCAALSMNLQLQAVEPTGGDLMETELWLVHRDPSGKETTQRQVVRSRGTAGTTFYFDDTKVETDKGIVNIEMYGTLGIASCCNGKLFAGVDLARRYTTTSPQFSWKTKGDTGNYKANTVDGEVVSLQLPPMADDDAALVGHRFSLRIRVRMLQ